MTEISDSELDSSNENQIGNTSDHENFDDSNIFDSDQGEEEEEDYGAFQDFDDFSDNQDNQDNQDFAPSPSRETNVEGLIMNTPDIELAEDGTPLVFLEKFKEFPVEIQMGIWRFSALQARRTIVMNLRQDTFEFENYPSTPAFMHVCQRARKYGRKYFYAVDEKGVPHNFTDPQKVNKPYFYVNPISDDFILRFGDEASRSSPAYCPIQFGSEYMQQELKVEERKLYDIDEEEERARYNARTIRINAPVPAHVNAPVVNTHILGGNMMIQHIQHNPAANAGVARPALPRPGEPVFPLASVLPHFFDNIRSVGINLSISFSGYVGFEEMTAAQLQQWTEDNVKEKFDNVFKKILDRFPHLEHIFVVVRAYGRSNRCESDRGLPRELEKKNWTSVGMEKGTARCMGYREFKQFENQAKVWLMHERIDRGLQLNSIDFGLYVQTNILWEI
ncbi:uncharacterized protein Bfra_000799 [Botrytis fragariae]|uniref:2EXR domain-containing protein n=1 Tax=Botrytis fragariae TaxID=1964551 RepID=A0A8H6B436_9HELO|nr:uncharacterized protein Bfra_000799 [Botrytis fragariae]KAF5878632.1 hypothetical protein Bfra_000799 [Botrytis fragariae]